MCLPDGTDHATVGYGPGHLENLCDFLLGARGKGLFDEESNVREVAQDLELDIAARARGTTKHGGRADDNGARTFTGQHVLDKVLESLEDTSVFICGTDEGLAFLLEDSVRTLGCGVDERNYLETGAELTEGA